ncbi:MAG: hypothetical protein DCE90_07825 [Pseudanabaena sp.]|nr:MAG: hypothetical protein DCE90_07825 [Pseudanabaena sp.]
MLLEKNTYLDLAIAPRMLIAASQLKVLEAVAIINHLNETTEIEQISALIAQNIAQSNLVEYRNISSLERDTFSSIASCVVVFDQTRLLGTFSQRDILRLIEKQVDLRSLSLGQTMLEILNIAPNVIKRSQIQDFDSMLNLLQSYRCEYLLIINDDDELLGVASKESICFARYQLAEDSLSNVEAQKRAVLTAIPDLIYRVSFDGNYLECFSSSYVANLLPPNFDPINKNIFEVVPPRLAERKLAAIRQAIATGEIQTFEQQLQIDGKIQHEEVQIVKVNDWEALTIIRNISDRKQAEEALRDSETRFRSIFDTTSVGISLASIEGRHLTVNKALCQMLGYSEAELLQTSFHDISHPDDLEKDLNQYQKLIDNEIDSYHIEKRYRAKNGSVFWTLISISLVRDLQGQPMYDIALIQNINELKNTQQELSQLNQELEMRIQQRTAALAKSEVHKQEILNAIPDLLLRLKVDGTCISCFLPRIPDQNAFFPVFNHISEVLSPEIVARQVEISKLAIATGEVQIYEHKILKYGKWVDEEVRISPCGDDEVLVLVRNISDRKQAEEALQLSNERLITTNQELERVTRLKDEFLATMSHELRTPLNAVLGIAEGLLDQVFGDLNERQKNSLRTIYKSGQHLLDLINDILDIAKIESGKFILDLAPVSIKSICEGSLDFVKHLAEQKNIQLELTINNGVPSAITIDERRMRQVLINLLGNAVKFTPKNGLVTLTVNLTRGEVAQSSDEERVQFCVSDTGIGIFPEDISRLFQPFVQISSRLNRQYAGTGLGLDLVKKLVELHGGWVSAVSEVGKGSCFTVSLPNNSKLQNSNAIL